MFSNSKPAASLSSGLLARKGQARPAMRPQGFHSHGMNLDDLGWNDMGETYAAPEPVLAAVTDIAEVPPVLVEREMLREEFTAEVRPVLPTPPEFEIKPEDEPELTLESEPDAEVEFAPLPDAKPVSVATAARIQREVKAGKPKAAFTLRLDTDRHLRLRLAVATRNRSAQALVTDALDALLASLPEVEELARQIPALKAVRSSGEKR